MFYRRPSCTLWQGLDGCISWLKKYVYTYREVMEAPLSWLYVPPPPPTQLLSGQFSIVYLLYQKAIYTKKQVNEFTLRVAICVVASRSNQIRQVMLSIPNFTMASVSEKAKATVWKKAKKHRMRKGCEKETVRGGAAGERLCTESQLFFFGMGLRWRRDRNARKYGGGHLVVTY